ncbi:MAG: hypothetical protein AAF950_18450 [Pseudomonadota bacterium]
MRSGERLYPLGDPGHSNSLAELAVELAGRGRALILAAWKQPALLKRSAFIEALGANRLPGSEQTKEVVAPVIMVPRGGGHPERPGRRPG